MQTQHAPLSDHDHKQRIDRLTNALNGALLAAAVHGLTVEMATLRIHTFGRAVEAQRLADRVAREVEVR